MIKPLLLCSLLLVLVWSLPDADAQYPVIDSANLAQSVYTVQNLLQMIGLKQVDLASIPNLGTIISMVAELNAAATEVGGILGLVDTRLAGWTTLTSTIPCTPTDLRSWNFQASTWAKDGAAEAGRITSLIRTTLGLTARLSGMLSAITGTTSGLQSVSAVVTLATTELKSLQTIVVPYQTSMLGTLQVDRTNELANICLQEADLQGWGRVTTWW